MADLKMSKITVAGRGTRLWAASAPTLLYPEQVQGSLQLAVPSCRTAVLPALDFGVTQLRAGAAADLEQKQPHFPLRQPPTSYPMSAH